MPNENETVWVTFNGEIYNFREVRHWLERRGHRFATQSDTEVIVHAYEEEGPECLKRFRGMFAFALWDEKKQLLLLARDRVGKKPLYFTEVAGQFVFASEIQALVEHPLVERKVDLPAIDDFMTFGYVPAPRTGFQGVYKLPPAHYLTVDLSRGGANEGRPRLQRYWQLDYTQKLMLDEDDAAEGLLEILTEAVRLRLIADVPVGALLSGGIDSGIVVALMSHLCGQGVKTFSIGFDEHAFNELPYARLVAEMYGTEHHEFVVRPNALEVLPMLVRHYGEPYADSSAVPSYYVAQLTRQHVKVALNGDGGDESFGGYERYLGSALADRYQTIPTLLRKGMLTPLAALVPKSLPRRSRLSQVRRFMGRAELPFARRYLSWVSYFDAEQKRDLYTEEFQNALSGHDAEGWLLRRFDAVHSYAGERLDALLAVDVESYLPYDLLAKMDIASMANSLEARSPFLDQQVMEYAARLPCAYKLRGTTLKYLLKKIGEKLLPKKIIGRRKMGFGVPIGDWLRRELRPLTEDLLMSSQSLTQRFLSAEKVHRLVEMHQQRQGDYSNQVWALLCFELWQREFKVAA